MADNWITPIDITKLIVEELGKEPFNLDFNVSSFGSLNPNGLHKILHTVLCDIDPKYKEETQNDSSCGKLKVDRVLEILKILRYRSRNDFQTDIEDILETGARDGMEDLLACLLLKRNELKERAYLAQFLVKVQIPEEFMNDNELAAVYEQYEEQMEKFIETHKKLGEMKRKMEQRPVAELVTDLGRIVVDVECLERKVDGIKNKLSHLSGKEQYLAKATEIRKAREKKASLKRQLDLEDDKLEFLQKRQELLYSEIADMVHLNEDGSPETALNRLEQDSEILKHIVEEKLPRQIERASRKYLAYKITEENPPICRSDLEFRKQRLDKVTAELAVLNRKKAVEDEDKLLICVREQNEKNQENKLKILTHLEVMRNEMEVAMSQAEESRGNFKAPSWGWNPGDHRQYVQNMRTKAAKYKEKRAQLQSLQAEFGNLAVTKFILDGDLMKSQEELQKVEGSLGLDFLGLSSNKIQEEVEKLSDKKCCAEQKKLEEIQNMSTLAKELNSQLWDSKSRWKSLIDDVKGKREELAFVREEAKEEKAKVENALASMNLEIRRLQEEVGKRWSQLKEEELKFAELKSEIPILKTEMLRAGTRNQGHYARNNADRVRGKIIESERIQGELKAEIEKLEEIKMYQENQRQMWSGLQTLLEAKAVVLNSRRQPSADNENYSSKQSYDSWENV